MRILGRFILVCALLGGLGYGSYAFGRHVLSNYMFGAGFGARPGSALDAGQARKPVTRQIAYKGQKPSVQVQVLPADEAGPGPVPPSSEVLERETQALPTPPQLDNATPAQRMVPQRARKFEEGERAALRDDTLRDDRNGRDNRTERRRRRRRRTTSETYRTARRERPETSGETSAPARREDRSFEAETPRAESRAESRSEVPRAETPRRTRPERSERREPRRESPVPRPEGGSSGGDSPVPQPE